MSAHPHTAPVPFAAPDDVPAAAPAPKRGRPARLAVLGAGGYAGQEFTRLALSHPGLEIVALSSREHAGRPAAALFPGVDPRASHLPAFRAPEELAGDLEAGAFDTVVACLPHGAWRELVAACPAFEHSAARVVDLSSDHRHAGALDPGAAYVYGLPEAFRARIASATRVSNPGCYPTAAALALMPALEADWLDGPVMVSALSGVSGAGRAPQLKTSYVELDGGASLYRAGGEHPHRGEIERTLEAIGGGLRAVGFAPQLAPMSRGILLTATAPLGRAIEPEEARARYLERYATEPFVHVLEPGVWPETRAVRNSNRCDLAVTTIHGGRTLLATAAIDNLVKGAAGQALQNLNLMLDWPEDWALPKHGSPW